MKMISATAFLLVFCAFPIYSLPYMHIYLTVVCGHETPYSYLATANVWDDIATGDEPILSDVRFTGRGVSYITLNGTIPKTLASVTAPYIKVRHTCTDEEFENVYLNLKTCPRDAEVCNYNEIMDITPKYTPKTLS